MDIKFWAKVSKAENGCWLWTGAKNSHGYGVVCRAGKMLYAHRVALSAKQPLTEGLTVDHLCFNRVCVNPAHLEEVTPEENIRRWLVRQKIEPCGHGFVRNRGSRCPDCKREVAQRYNRSFKGQGRKQKPDVEELRNAMQTMTWADIGREYGVTDNGARKWAQKFGLLP